MKAKQKAKPNSTPAHKKPERTEEEIYLDWHGIPDNFPDWVVWYITDTDKEAGNILRLFMERNIDSKQPDKNAKDFDKRLNVELLAFWKVAAYTFDFQVLYRMKEDRKNLFRTDDYDWGKKFLQTKVDWCKESIQNIESKADVLSPPLSVLRHGLKWRGSPEQLELLLADLVNDNLLDPNWKASFQGLKIKWMGNDTEIGVILKLLSSKNKISLNYQPIADQYFIHTDGTAISRNLSVLASKESKQISALYQKYSQGLDRIFPPEQGERKG